MFRCQVTGKMSKRGEKMHRVVVETRDKEYVEERIVDGKKELVTVGFGYETVREVICTEEGKNLLEKMLLEIEQEQASNSSMFKMAG